VTRVLEALHDEPMRLAAALAYAMPRLLGVFTMLPLLSREALPMTLRMGVVGCFALLLVPGLAESAPHERPAVEAALILLREACFGALLGLVLGIPLWAVEAMGDLVDTQRGTNLSETLNPLTGQEVSPLGQLFNQAIVTFMFTTGGFLLTLSVVYESFAFWPVLEPWPGFGPEAPAALLGLADRLMRLMVLLAAPVVFAMFICEAGLALVSRFVPQLQVFFLAMPIKSAVAMAVFAIYAAVLFDTAHGVLRETFLDAPAVAGEILRPARAR
jgi:type III secretion protein T